VERSNCVRNEMRRKKTYRVVCVLEKIRALLGSESVCVVVEGMRWSHGDEVESGTFWWEWETEFEIWRGEGLVREKTW